MRTKQKYKTGDRVRFEYKANLFSSEILQATRKIEVSENNIWVRVRGHYFIIEESDIIEIIN